MEKREIDIDGYEELKEKLRINRDALDRELVRQPQLFMEVSEHFAQAISRRDFLKEKSKQVDAEVSMTIRRKHEGEKLTEAMVTSMILQHPEHMAVTKKLNLAIREADLWAALKESFQQRSYALKDLAGLFIAGYFGSSSVRGKASEEVQERAYMEQRGRRKMGDSEQP